MVIFVIKPRLWIALVIEYNLESLTSLTILLTFYSNMFSMYTQQLNKPIGVWHFIFGQGLVIQYMLRLKLYTMYKS